MKSLLEDARTTDDLSRAGVMQSTGFVVIIAMPNILATYSNWCNNDTPLDPIAAIRNVLFIENVT